MSLESNKKKYKELANEYNTKYNNIVSELRQTLTPEYMVVHVAKSFLIEESYQLDALNAMIQTKEDYMVFKSRGSRKANGHS